MSVGDGREIEDLKEEIKEHDHSGKQQQKVLAMGFAESAQK